LREQGVHVPDPVIAPAPAQHLLARGVFLEELTQGHQETPACAQQAHDIYLNDIIWLAGVSIREVPAIRLPKQAKAETGG
jgi:hypothetical protein